MNEGKKKGRIGAIPLQMRKGIPRRNYMAGWVGAEGRHIYQRGFLPSLLGRGCFSTRPLPGRELRPTVGTDPGIKPGTCRQSEDTKNLSALTSIDRNPSTKHRLFLLSMVGSENMVVFCVDRRGAAQVCPIDMWAEVFASDDTGRFALDVDSQGFSTWLTVGNISKVTTGRSAALRKRFALGDREAHEKGFVRAHGRYNTPVGVVHQHHFVNIYLLNRLV